VELHHLAQYRLLILPAVLLVRFFRSGGLDMLRMMGGSPDAMAGHDHGEHDRRGSHSQAGDAEHEDHAEHTGSEAQPDDRHAGHGHHHARKAVRLPITLLVAAVCWWEGRAQVSREQTRHQAAHVRVRESDVALAK
jgi:hypothetical protein